MVKAAAKTRRAKASREDASGDGQLHGRLFYSLKHAQGRARAALDEAFGQIGLTTPQFLALNAIDENARSSSAELARHSYVSPQAMMTIIARLESSGLIARTPDPQGGRSLETALTQKGVRLLQRARERATSLEKYIADLLGPKATKSLLESLDRITQACCMQDVTVTKTRPWDD
jgi:DNA-binding MarR family transcriptional regulator